MVGHPRLPAGRALLTPARRIRSDRLRSYGAVAWCYDELASIGSFGRIRAAKHAQLADLSPGERVLYAGVGRGEEALLAARLGARVTALDCAPQMLDRLRRAAETAELPVETVLGDLFSHRAPEGGYDCIAAHFVLNVFDREQVGEALRHWIAQLRPGGRLCIADFAAAGPGLGGLAARAHFRLVNAAGFVLGLAAWHPLYDYEAMLEPLGWCVVRRVRFGAYESLTFEAEAQRARRASASSERPVSSSSTA